MNWQKWTIDNLPEANRTVLIWYKSGQQGSLKFFVDDAQRDLYISGMKEPYTIQWHKSPYADPITHWMPLPDAPREENDRVD